MSIENLKDITASQLGKHLTQKYQEYGLKLVIQNGCYLITSGNFIGLTVLYVGEDSRQQGIGTKIMQDIIKWSDVNKKIIGLTPTAEFGSTKSRLIRFYKRFGFVENKGENRDYTILEAMYRTPTPITDNQAV